MTSPSQGRPVRKWQTFDVLLPRSTSRELTRWLDHNIGPAPTNYRIAGRFHPDQFYHRFAVSLNARDAKALVMFKLAWSDCFAG
jgi:hypothetical protein